MEDSRNKKPLTDNSETEGKCGNKKPYLLPSSSSSSKPPLRPVALLLKKPNNNNNSEPSLFSAIEAVSANNSEQDKNQTSSSSAHMNNNVVLKDASSDQYHHETSNLETSKNQNKQPKVTDPSEDARKLKRVMSNRMSAHRSRLRKLEHVANLERQCVQLKNQISVLQPQVEAFGNLKHMLMLEQTVLTQRVEALENERLVKQGEIERNQEEVYRLREIEKRRKEDEAHQAMMAFANWDTLPNSNHQTLLDSNIPAHHDFENMEETSGMEVDDEQTMNNMNSLASLNELDAIVNPPKLSDNDMAASSEYRFYF